MPRLSICPLTISARSFFFFFSIENYSPYIHIIVITGIESINYGVFECLLLIVHCMTTIVDVKLSISRIQFLWLIIPINKSVYFQESITHIHFVISLNIDQTIYDYYYHLCCHTAVIGWWFNVYYFYDYYLRFKNSIGVEVFGSKQKVVDSSSWMSCGW